MPRRARLKLETLTDRIAPAAGALDPTFGGDNKVVTSFGPSEDEAYSVALQADGKIVTAGRTYNGSNYDFAVVRYRIDGTLDTTFDGDGKLTTTFGAGDDMAHAVAVQSDGRIVVVGYSNLTSADIALARYNPDGSLDSTFGVGGKVTTDFGFVLDIANAVAIQPDGKIVIAGMSPGSPSGYDFCVVRYNVDGSLDADFGTHGKVRVPIGIGMAFDEAKSIALQSDGKIVVGGISYNGTNFDFALARFTANGLLDDTFSDDGRLTLALGTGDDYCRSLAVQPDGKIVAVGSSFNGTNNDYALARFNADGGLDTSFSGDGMHTAAFGTIQDVATAVTVLPNGKILIAGSGFNGSVSGFAIARYNSNGTLDGTFGGGDGMDISAIGSSFSGAAALAMQTDGRIVLAGYSEVGIDKDFALLRYKADGSLDKLADGTGKVTTAFGSANDQARSVAIQPDGKIVVAGYSLTAHGGNSDDDFTVARYNADGSLDTSFAGDGIALADFGNTDQPAGMAIDTNGKIVVVGLTFTGGTFYNFALARFNTDGSLDSSFGTGGMVVTDFNSSSDYAQSVAIDGNGKIVVAGYTLNGGNYDYALARYNTDGSLDSHFDVDGKLITSIGPAEDVALCVAVQNDGKIIAAGYSDIGGYYDFALARFNTDGSPDNTFDNDGKLTAGVAGQYDVAQSIVIQLDGKIIAAGHSLIGGSNDFAVARFNLDGSSDISFDDDGWVVTSIGSAKDLAYGVALQADGKIVAAGYSNINGAGNHDFALVRYTSNGSLDSTFDGDGKVIIPVGSSDDIPTSVAIQADGKIVAAGYSFNGNNNDFALIRVRGDNQAPVALPATLNVTEDTVLSVTNPTYISEPDGDAFTATLLTGPAHGTLNFTIYGTFTYTPDPDYFGTDSFSYKVKDLDGALDAGTVFFNVISANDNPTAVNDSANVVINGGAQDIDVLANDSLSPDVGETLSITAVTQASYGTVSIVGGGTSVAYSPDTGYSGMDSFEYAISDGNGGTSTATVDVVVGSGSVTLSGVPVSANINEGETLSFTATATGTNLTFSLDGAPSAATIDPSTGQFSWTTTEADGPDTFVFNVQVTNGSATAEKKVTVIIAELNTAPVLNDVPAAALLVRGETLKFTATSTDDDRLNGFENTRTFNLVGAPSDASIHPDTGVFTWTPSDKTSPGTYSFEVRVADDGVPFLTDIATISVTVQAAYLQSGKLMIGGTAGNDTITVNPSKDLSQIMVKLGRVTLGTFTAENVNRIEARGLGGNDRITVNAKITKPVDLYGGFGNDVLTGGSGDDRLFGEEGNDILSGAVGNDFLFGAAGKDILKGGADKNVLVGGADNDILTGGTDRDVLIGGTGSDRLAGGGRAGEDLLIGGSTSFDTDLTGLTSLFNDWNSAATYAERIDTITPDGLLNGASQLSALTVQDTEKDILTGAGGLDWFVVSATDKRDLKTGEATPLTV